MEKTQTAVQRRESFMAINYTRLENQRSTSRFRVRKSGMTAATFNVGSNIPYAGASYRMSHPRRLEALATLSGMHPQPLPAARVLELGCAAGRNLIPQAVNYPDAEFVGVDVSARQIAENSPTSKLNPSTLTIFFLSYAVISNRLRRTPSREV